MHAGRSNAAYHAIGLACRMCYQLGLHRQDQWESLCSPYEMHMRQRLIWTVYFVDRRVSLSCGRPYSMLDGHLHVEKPLQIDDKVRSIHFRDPLVSTRLCRYIYGQIHHICPLSTIAKTFLSLGRA